MEVSTASEGNLSQDYLVHDFTPRFSLEPKKTALLIVDLQYTSGCRTMGLGKLMKELGREAELAYRFERQETVVIPNVQQILTFFREHGLQVIHLTFGAELTDLGDIPRCFRPIARAMNSIVGTAEHRILEQVKPIEGELVINKRSASPFNSTGIDNVLRNMGIQYLIVTGISTNMCIETTARDAADRGYSVVVVEDCCGADSEAYHEAALRSFSRLCGLVDSLDNVLASLGAALERSELSPRGPLAAQQKGGK